MITEAGTTEMEAAVLMRICKLRDRSPESESEIPTNGYSVFNIYVTNTRIHMCSTVDGSDAHLPLLPAVAYFGSGNSETTLTGATRAFCHAILPLTSAQAMAYK